MDFNNLDSCTSLGGINIRMLGFVIQVRIQVVFAKFTVISFVKHGVAHYLVKCL